MPNEPKGRKPKGFEKGADSSAKSKQSKDGSKDKKQRKNDCECSKEQETRTKSPETRKRNVSGASKGEKSPKRRKRTSPTVDAVGLNSKEEEVLDYEEELPSSQQSRKSSKSVDSANSRVTT